MGQQEAAEVAECRIEECKEECKVVRAAGTVECKAANKADRRNREVSGGGVGAHAAIINVVACQVPKFLSQGCCNDCNFDNWS